MKVLKCAQENTRRTDYSFHKNTPILTGELDSIGYLIRQSQGTITVHWIHILVNCPLRFSQIYWLFISVY